MSALLDRLFIMRGDIIAQACKKSNNALEILEDIYLSHILLLKQYKGFALIYFSDFINFEHPELGQRMRKEIAKDKVKLAEIIEAGKRNEQLATNLGTEQVIISFICLYIMPSMLKSRDLHQFDLEEQTKANWTIFRSALLADKNFT